MMAGSAARAGAGGTLSVMIVAYHGVDELDLFGAYVPLAKAGAHAPRGQGLAVAIAAAEREVVGSHGVPVRAARSLGDLPAANAVVVPGGRGARAASRDQRYVQALARAYRAGAALYAVCSGSFLIAGAGLARGRALAVHAAKRHQLAELGGCQVTESLVRDGRICSIGGTRDRRVKSVDIAFQVLRDWLPDAVEPVAQRLETEPGGPALEWRR